MYVTRKERARANRNLLLTALVAVGIAAALALWYGHRKQQEQAVARAALRELVQTKLHGEAPAATLDGTYPCMLTALNAPKEKPELTRCSTPTSHKGAVDQVEVDLRFGAFEVRQTDLEVNDVFDVPLTRTYNSVDWVGGNRVEEFGKNTNHPYDAALLGTRNPYTFMDLMLADGESVYYERVSPGTGYADAVYQHTETSTRFYKSTINWNGNGWTLRLTDGEEIFFPESFSAKNLAQGAATEIKDAQGNKLELKRDGQRNLMEIQTPHGHWIKFTYDGGPRIAKAEDDAGHWAKYTYNRAGMLTDVVDSDGQARHYNYQGSWMTEILDGQGHVLVQNTYANDVLTQQTYPNGKVYKYAYTWSRNGEYTLTATITMPDGSTQEVTTGSSVPNRWRR
ncbi:MAG TPA: DUF6531 domain-containing protein [Acidobacteriaceae bacterium]|nr:DUF6531 domain-containing protein [Acidobacteriaceae bacterium]